MTKLSFFRFSAAALLAGSAISLAACGSKPADKPMDDAADVAAPLSALEAAIAAPGRGDNALRDGARNPQATLEFFKLSPDMSVLEISPGSGYYADILTAYLASGTGAYLATSYPVTGKNGERRAAANLKFAEKYPAATSYTFGGNAKLPEGVADRVLTFRNVHSWMRGGTAEDVFAQFYGALKPGGMLGVVQHRLPATAEQDPRAPTGYVQEAYVKSLAAAAGFEFVDSSEINANPKDTTDHPYGVWTLPPRLLGPKKGADAGDYDKAKYQAIGESDRMTLLFKKP